MHKFSIKIGNVRYEGVFANSIDAVRDALQRFPSFGVIVVKAIK